MKPKQAFEYSIMKDSHMHYFLQSVPKVKELLATGLYRLEEGNLFEVATKQSVKLDPYVVDKLKDSIMTTQDQNQQQLNAVLQSEKFKAFEEERERLRRMRQDGSGGESRVRSQLENIKGLKEFLARQGKWEAHCPDRWIIYDWRVLGKLYYGVIIQGVPSSPCFHSAIGPCPLSCSAMHSYTCQNRWDATSCHNYICEFPIDPVLSTYRH